MLYFCLFSLLKFEDPDDFHRQTDWTASLGANHALFACPLDMGETSSIDEWAAGTYNTDDVVFHNRKIYQVVASPSTTAAPASNSTDWAEYDYNFLTGNTHDNTIVEDEQVVYKRMEVESQLGSDADATTGFVEYKLFPAVDA